MPTEIPQQQQFARFISIWCYCCNYCRLLSLMMEHSITTANFTVQNKTRFKALFLVPHNCRHALIRQTTKAQLTKLKHRTR